MEAPFDYYVKLIGGKLVSKNTLAHRAKLGDSDAQYKLASSLLNSNQARNKDEGLKWLKIAAEQQHPEALCDMGVHYYYGDGVKRDVNKAFEYFLLSSKMGSPHGQFHVGLCYEDGDGTKRNTHAAFEFYYKAAVSGQIWAQVKIAFAYYEGIGISKNYGKAIKWYRRAARKGDPNAENAIGVAYDEGKGVRKDSRRAIYWFRKAAKQGDPDAQYNLGLCYLDGDGVRTNLHLSKQWLTKSKNGGVVGAGAALREIAQIELKNKMIWKPRVGIGPFEIGTPIDPYISEYGLVRSKEEEKDLSGWKTYRMDRWEVRIYSDKNNIVSVLCDDICFYKGENIVGMDIDRAFAKIGVEKTSPRIEICEGETHYVYDVDKYDVQIWVLNGKVVTIIA